MGLVNPRPRITAEPWLTRQGHHQGPFFIVFIENPLSSRLQTPLEQTMTVVMLLVLDQDHGKWPRQYARQFVRISPPGF